MTTAERALPLIDLIYRGAADPESWPAFIGALSEEFGGAAVALSMQLPGYAPPVAIYRVGFLDEYSATFAKFLEQGLPWGLFRDTRPDQRFVRASDSLPDHELAATDFYREYMKPQGFAAEGPIVHLIFGEEGGMFSGLAIYRVEGQRAFTDEDLRLGDLLVPHLSRAFKIHGLVGGIQRARIALAEVIDRLPTGVILIDSARQPVVTNRGADQILELHDGFELDTRGCRASDPRDDEKLQTLITSAVSVAPGRELSEAGFVAVSRPSGLRPYTVMVTPLLAAPPETTVHDSAAILFISDPETGHVGTQQILSTVYLLTEAEAELVQLLSQGHSLDEAAKLRGVTMNTARSQLKQVFAKTDTKRQGELVRLVLTGVASLGEQ